MSFNFFYFQDEQACLTRLKQFRNEDLEKVKADLSYYLGKEVYAINFQEYNGPAEHIEAKKILYKTVTIGCEQYTLMNGTKICKMYLKNVMKHNDIDENWRHAYTWTPIIETNAPSLEQHFFNFFLSDEPIVETETVAEYHLEWPKILLLYCFERKGLFIQI